MKIEHVFCPHREFIKYEKKITFKLINNCFSPPNRKDKLDNIVITNLLCFMYMAYLLIWK